MRWTSVGRVGIVAGVASAAVLLSLAGTAGAAGGTTGRGETGGKGGAGGRTGRGDSAKLEDNDFAQGSRIDRGADEWSPTALRDRKRWQVLGTWELHHLVRQNDLGGAARNKNFNYFDLEVRYEITNVDRVSIAEGLYQRFLADPEETGLRNTDLEASYRRLVPLPYRVLLKATGTITAPISFTSKKSGLITAPRVSVQAERRFGDFTVQAGPSGTYYISKYRSSEGGNANAKARLGVSARVEYELPFFRDVTFGLAASTNYYWYYEIASDDANNPSFRGTVVDSQFATQPVQQTYGGQLYGRYLIPELVKGLGSDITLAYGLGDPTLGSTPVVREGARFVNFYYRRTSEVYAALAVRY